jgi:hypothetical protein
VCGGGGGGQSTIWAACATCAWWWRICFPTLYSLQCDRGVVCGWKDHIVVHLSPTFWLLLHSSPPLLARFAGGASLHASQALAGSHAMDTGDMGLSSSERRVPQDAGDTGELDTEGDTITRPCEQHNTHPTHAQGKLCATAMQPSAVPPVASPTFGAALHVAAPALGCLVCVCLHGS